jgi:Flp pilus assembly protein protease CpaA
MLPVFYALALVSLVYVSIAVYIDLKDRIIPDALNYLIILGCLAFSIIQNVILGFILIAAASFAFAYILYKLGVWGGGDVKFFVGLNGLMFFLTGFNWLGIFYLFFISAVLSIPLLIVIHFRELIELRKRFDIIKNFKSAVSSSISSAGVTSLLLFLRVNFNISFVVFILLLLVFFLVRIPIYLSVLLLIMGFYFYGLTVIAFLALALVLSFISIVLIQAFSITSKEILRKEVELKDLKEGMIPANSLFIENGIVKEFSLNEMINQALKGTIAKPLITTSAEGLTKEQIKELKSMKVKHISVKESFPFAPFLGVGFVCMVFLWIALK